MKTVVLRADGGPTLGMGHVRRCLSLAAALRDGGAHVVFVVNRACRLPELSTPAVDLVEVADDEINDLEATRRELRAHGAAALVADSYAIGAAALRDVDAPTTVIVDGPPSAALPVALVTDSAIDARSERWPSHPGTQLLLGPDYVLLRPGLVASSRPRTFGDIERVLVTTGGTDPRECCARFVAVALATWPDAVADVIVGPYFTEQATAALRRLAAADRRVVMHAGTCDIATLMRGADIAVSAGGQTLYELAATGTPTVGVSLARNQQPNLSGFAARGALVWAGDVADGDLDRRIAAALRECASVDVRAAMSAAGRSLVDGRGAERVAAAVLTLEAVA